MTEPDTKITRIQDRLDKDIAGHTAIGHVGGVQFSDMGQVMEFAKLVSLSGSAVPQHLRGNPGACLSIVTRALRFNFDAFELACHSFPGGNANAGLTFDSSVIHAVINAHAKLMGQLQCKYEGDGDDRVCVVSGVIRGEQEPHTYKSPSVGAIKAKLGKNDRGQVKGSPLWTSDPDQQQWYFARRNWCRKWCPEVLLGWYDREEIEESDIDPPKPSPNLLERLKDREVVGEVITEGFNRDKVHAEINAKAEPETAAPKATPLSALTDKAKTYVQTFQTMTGNAIDPVAYESWWTETTNLRKAAKLPTDVLGDMVATYSAKLESLKAVETSNAPA